MSGTQARDGYVATVRRLAGAQKPLALGAPAYSHYVNRPIGRYLAAAAYHLGMTPNQVTAVSALVTASGIVTVATVRASWPVAVAVAVALVLGYALDSADGQLARLRGGGSPAGEWLDHVVDCAKVSALHGAVLIALYRFADVGGPALLIPLGYQLVGSVAFFAMILNDQLTRVYAGSSAVRLATRPLTLRSVAVLPVEYGVLCLSFVLLGHYRTFLVVYAALLICNALYLVAALVKWYRTMGTLTRR